MFLTAIARKRLQRNELFAGYTSEWGVFFVYAGKKVRASRKSSFRGAEKSGSYGGKFILGLQIIIFKLRIIIFRLQIIIFRLKIIFLR